jgi:hypothetical protein
MRSTQQHISKGAVTLSRSMSQNPTLLSLFLGPLAEARRRAPEAHRQEPWVHRRGSEGVRRICSGLTSMRCWTSTQPARELQARACSSGGTSAGAAGSPSTPRRGCRGGWTGRARSPARAGGGLEATEHFSSIKRIFGVSRCGEVRQVVKDKEMAMKASYAKYSLCRSKASHERPQRGWIAEPLVGSCAAKQRTSNT